MNTEDLATKQDLALLKEDILKELPKAQPQNTIKQGMTARQVKIALGGVSFNFIVGLRRNKILSANKIGGAWIYNYQEVMDCIPNYKKK